MPEVSITVMRTSGETLRARQGIQQLASKDCLICGRSYRYSHNARRHELASHSFDRYTNKVTTKKSHPMTPKLRPNPFNPKARLMPNPISHKLKFMSNNQHKGAPPILIPPKPIPIKTVKPAQNLPYPLRIKALKDLQIKKKEPQILKTLLTSKPEVLVSEPEILNSGPESPETLISEPEIASFQVETILTEANDYDQHQDEGEAEQNNQNQSYDTVEMESDHEIEIAHGQDNEGEDDGKDADFVENDEEENAGDEQQEHIEENEKQGDSENEDYHDAGDGDSRDQMEIDESGLGDKVDGDIENDAQEVDPDAEVNDDEDDMPPAELDGERRSHSDDDDVDDTADLNDTADEEKVLEQGKTYITRAQKEFITKYRDIIKQINTKRCLCCDKTYPRRKAVVQHLQKNGHKVPKHTCYNCVITFGHIGALLSHMRANTCTDLWKIIFEKDEIPEDMVAEPAPDQPKTAYKDIFNARSYACRICPAKFSLKQSIMKHVFDVHEDGQPAEPLTCVHCRNTFKDKALLKKHVRIGECTVCIDCDLCAERFSNMSDFTEHALSAHADRLDSSAGPSKCIDGRATDCGVCGKATSSYQHLVKHLRVAHNDERPHHCQHCDAKFEQAADLNRHIYDEHSAPPDLSRVKEEAEEYHYSCTECEAIFETVDAWTDHQVAEHGQVAHRCDQCDKKFLRPSELAEHKNTHLRVKFYSCAACPNSYGTPQKLAEHVRAAHPAADADFHCQTCDRSFKSRQAYSNHMRIHSKVPTTNRKPGEGKGFDPRIIGKPIRHIQPQPGFVNFKPNAVVPNAPYSCDICGKGFMHKKNIWKHKKVLHADVVADRHNDSEDNTMHASTEDDECPPHENGALSTPQFDSFDFSNFAESATPPQPQPQAPAAEPAQYSCELCFKRFPVKTSLWKHKRAKHGITNPGSNASNSLLHAQPKSETGRSSCTICKITFADKKSYYRHRKNVHKTATEMCKLCGKPLNSTLELYEHLKAAHARELLGYNAGAQDAAAPDGDAEPAPADYQARYPCDTCGRHFVGLLALQNHQCVERPPAQPQTFDCEICHKSYTSIAALKSHRGWHLRSPDGKAAANNSGLWMPQHKVTGKVSKHEVVEARATKRRAPDLELAVVSPDKKPRSEDSEPERGEAADGRYCTICEREFTKRAAYQRHVEEVHRPNSVFCPVCERSFTRKSTLLVHMRKHYESGEAAESGEEPEPPPGEFTCAQCGEGVATPRDLLAHRAVHATPTRFFCNICRVYFARALDLSAHTRARHSSDDKVFFPCAMCDRFYMNKKSLQRHIEMTH